MIRKDFMVEGIPAILWGPESPKLFIAVHGNHSCKDDKIIALFAEKAVEKGYQVLSFDLPEHGEHYFHTEEQLDCYGRWLVEQLL